MAIQYLLVTFPQARAVLADGNGVGFTNHILMLPGDEYEISLEGGGCDPASQMIALGGTSMIKPMVVAFAATTPVLDAVAEAAACAPASESAADVPDDATAVLVVSRSAWPGELQAPLPATRGAARKSGATRSRAAKTGAAGAPGGSDADAARAVDEPAGVPRKRGKRAATATPTAAKKPIEKTAPTKRRSGRKAEEGG